METLRKNRNHLKRMLWIAKSKDCPLKLLRITPLPHLPVYESTFISQSKATPHKQKRAIKTFPRIKEKSPVLWMCSVFYLFSIFCSSRSHARNIKKWSRCSLSLFVHRVINSSKHFYPIIWIKRQPKDQHLSQVLKISYVSRKFSQIIGL